ncbi:MAG: TolC family protein [Planctomycetota bacterium]|nr:TolC family protein [Planctomycetota bacterium]
MRVHWPKKWTSKFIPALCLTVSLAGCLGTGKEDDLTYIGKKDLNYYRDVATQIEFPDVSQPLADNVQQTLPPHSIKDLANEDIWDMTLAEAIQIALSNSEVIRVAGTLGSPTNQLLANGDRVATIYDPSIQETGVLFGTRGVEAALAAFDTQFTTNMLWGRNEQVQNNRFFSGNLTPGSTLNSETGAFLTALQKQLADGGQLTLSHNWDYLGNNVPAANILFPSTYTGSVALNYRRPLWAAAGVEFTQVAGPPNQNTAFQSITGVSQGVAIARINQDITLAEFEANVQSLLLDVERLYWQLHLSYRVYDSVVVAKNSTLRSWREAKAILDAGGGRNFKPADEAQARDQYFQARSQAESALSQIYTNELNFRRLLALPINDGRVIRPHDEPITASYSPEWTASVTEGLVRRVELRRQKWNIKSLQLQLDAANSLTHPRLDFVSGYRVNGFGDQLFGDQDNDSAGTAQGFRSAYETITQGNQTGWQLGFEFSMPIGFRQALTQVRNYELRLAKARAVLAAQEGDVTAEIGLSFQQLARFYATAQSNFNRWRAARKRVEFFNEEVRTGTTTLDALLRAQSSLAQAEIEYYQSLIDYNIAIAELNYRKGTILDYNNVFLNEGDWDDEAYSDAVKRAWARTHAFDATNMLDQQPDAFSMEAPYDVDWARGIETDNGDDLLPPPEMNDPISDDALNFNAPDQNEETQEPAIVSPSDAVPIEDKVNIVPVNDELSNSFSDD